MADAWTSITGPYYVPPPDQPPNFFAAYMSEFLRTRAPYAQAIFEKRLQAVDPYAKWQMYAQLAKMSSDTYDSISRAYSARASADASTQAELLRLQQTLIQDNTARSRIAADVAIANQDAATKLTLSRGIHTAGGQQKLEAIDSTLSSFQRAVANGEQQAVDNLRNNLVILQRDISAITDPGERDALLEHLNNQVAHTGNVLGEADRTNLGAEVRTLFPAVTPLEGVVPAGGGGPADYNRITQNAQAMAQALGLGGGSSGGGRSVGVSGRGGVPDPTAVLQQQADLAKQLANINPFESLGWFGQPVPVHPDAAVAYLRQAQHRAFAANGATPPAPAAATGPAPPPSPVARPTLPTPTQVQSGLVALQRPAPSPSPVVAPGAPPARAAGYPGTAEPFVPTPPPPAPAARPFRSDPSLLRPPPPPPVAPSVESTPVPWAPGQMTGDDRLQHLFNVDAPIDEIQALIDEERRRLDLAERAGAAR